MDGEPVPIELVGGRVGQGLMAAQRFPGVVAGDKSLLQPADVGWEVVELPFVGAQAALDAAVGLRLAGPVEVVGDAGLCDGSLEVLQELAVPTGLVGLDPEGELGYHYRAQEGGALGDSQPGRQATARLRVKQSTAPNWYATVPRPRDTCLLSTCTRTPGRSTPTPWAAAAADPAVGLGCLQQRALGLEATNHPVNALGGEGHPLLGHPHPQLLPPPPGILLPQGLAALDHGQRRLRMAHPRRRRPASSG